MKWAKMNAWGEKEGVMRNKNKLGSEPLLIDQDRMKAERDARRKIVEFAKKEKDKGKEVDIRFWKIESNVRKYRWSEREGKIVEEKEKVVFSRQDNRSARRERKKGGMGGVVGLL